MDEWNRFEEKLKNLPVASKDARAFVRYFFSGAVLSDMDRQGRLIIPQNLREHAKIDKEIVIIGVLSRVEIWDKSEWESYNDSADLGYDAVSEKMAELGI
jgi:MraZ protein